MGGQFMRNNRGRDPGMRLQQVRVHLHSNCFPYRGDLRHLRRSLLVGAALSFRIQRLEHPHRAPCSIESGDIFNATTHALHALCRQTATRIEAKSEPDKKGIQVDSRFRPLFVHRMIAHGTTSLASALRAVSEIGCRDSIVIVSPKEACKTFILADVVDRILVYKGDIIGIAIMPILALGMTIPGIASGFQACSAWDARAGTVVSSIAGYLL